MKKKRLVVMVGMFLIISMVLGACAKKAEDTASVSFDRATENKADGEYVDVEGRTEEAEAPAAQATLTTTADTAEVKYGSNAGSLNNSSAIKVEASSVLQSQDKIIRTFYMDVETQDFDSLITKLSSEINRLNGYVESSKISGRSYYDSEGARYADITARVPKEKVDEFVSTVGENANVIDKQESTENVTLQYTDIESRKKSLEIEQDRLFALLEKTDTLESIVTLESRLSEIRYELQNYETTLRTYDNKVEYSTVTLSIQEVKKLTPSVEIKQTMGTRMKNGFNQTMYQLNEGFQNFLVWVVVNLPYLILWAVIITILTLIVRRILKKVNRDKSVNPPSPPTPPTSEA